MSLSMSIASLFLTTHLVSPLLDLSLGGCGKTVWKAKAMVMRARARKVKKVRVSARKVWWRAA